MLYIILIFIAALALGVLVLILNNKRNRKNCTCPECKEKYDFKKDVSYEVIQVNEIRDERPRDVAEVRLTAVCPKCNYERVYMRKYNIAVWDQQKNSWKHYKLETLVENSFVYYDGLKGVIQQLKKELKDR